MQAFTDDGYFITRRPGSIGDGGCVPSCWTDGDFLRLGGFLVNPSRKN